MNADITTQIDLKSPPHKKNGFDFQKFLHAWVYTFALSWAYHDIWKPLDKILADRYGHEPILQLLDRVTTKLDVIIDKNTIPWERKNRHISIPKSMDQLGENLIQDFKFIEFISTLDPSQLDKEWPLINYMVGYGLGMFPKNLIQKHINIIMIWTIEGNSIYAKTKIDGYSDWKTKLIKLEPDIYPTVLHISSKTIRHEIIHAIFWHRSNTYWESRWKKEVGDHSDLSDNFTWTIIWGKPYWSRNLHEDMATIWAEMLSLGGLERLNKKANPIILKKIAVMKSFLYEISQWSMNEEYWENIKTGNIRHGIQAQEFFNKQ